MACGLFCVGHMCAKIIHTPRDILNECKQTRSPYHVFLKQKFFIIHFGEKAEKRQIGVEIYKIYYWFIKEISN